MKTFRISAVKLVLLLTDLQENNLNIGTRKKEASLCKGLATQKAGCHSGQAVAGNRSGLRSGDARQGAAAKSSPV